MRVEQIDTPFTGAAARPGAAAFRSRTAKAITSRADDVLDRLEGDGSVIFRYVDAATASRPSGEPERLAARNIAGICNERRNVIGMMPHPERACEPLLGSGDGLVLFESVVRAR